MAGLSDALAGDGVAVGAGVSTYAPSVIEVYGDLGLDFAWVDLEHGGPSPWDSQAVSALVRAAEVADTHLVVRPPSADPSLVRKLLDTGLQTLLLPRIDTAAEAEAAIRASRFDYRDEPGERGASISRASSWNAYDQAADRAPPTIGVMIESERAMDNLADILAVPGLGFVYVGPGDLSVSLGRPLETDSTPVTERIEAVLRACRKASIPAGRSVNSPEALASAGAAGWRVIRCGDEFSALRAHLGPHLAALGRDGGD